MASLTNLPPDLIDYLSGYMETFSLVSLALIFPHTLRIKAIIRILQIIRIQRWFRHHLTKIQCYRCGKWIQQSRVLRKECLNCHTTYSLCFFTDRNSCWCGEREFRPVWVDQTHFGDPGIPNISCCGICHRMLCSSCRIADGYWVYCRFCFLRYLWIRFRVRYNNFAYYYGCTLIFGIGYLLGLFFRLIIQWFLRKFQEK